MYTCNYCSYIHFKTKKEKKLGWKASWRTLKVLFWVFVVLGFFAVYNVSISDGYGAENLMTSSGGLPTVLLNQMVQLEGGNYPTYRGLTENLTKGCKSEYCEAKNIYDYLLTFDYEVGENHNPLTIWKEKSGDCDEMAYLYVSLLNALDIGAKLQCSSNHCWAIIHPDGKLIKADLTKFQWVEYKRW